MGVTVGEYQSDEAGDTIYKVKITVCYDVYYLSYFYTERQFLVRFLILFQRQH